MENNDDFSEMIGLKELTIKALEECEDIQLLDLIYKLLVYQHKE